MINRRFTKGLNLIELLLVLGVISILIIAAFLLFPNVRAEVNADKELKNVAAIQANVSVFSNGISDFKALNNEVAINARIVPSGMVQETAGVKEIKNLWGGDVVLNGVPEYNYKQYWITYTGVPKEACQQFSLAMLNGSKALNVGGIQVRYHTDATADWKPNETRVQNIGEGCSTSAGPVTIIAQYSQ